MTVELMLRDKGGDVQTVTPETTIMDTAKMLAAYKIGAVLVKPKGVDQLSGIISERDIVRGLSEMGADLMSKPVSTLMTTKLVTCKRTDTVNEIMNLMTQKRIRHLPVLEGDKLVGIISIGDVVRQRMQELEVEANSLRDYVSGGY